jgi:hypothetical protein
MAPEAKDLINKSDFKWIADSTPNFNFYFEENSWAAKNSHWVKENAEESFRRVLSLIGEKEYSNKIHYFIVGSRLRMKDLIGRETNGEAFPNRNLICAIANDTVKALGAHELFHVMSMNLWGVPEEWLSEGMAVYSDNNWWGNDLHSLVKFLSEKRKLIRIKDLISSIRSYDNMISYPEIGSFVKYLYETYGLAKIRNIWKDGSSKVKREFGKSVDELEKDWLNEIIKANSENISYKIK